MKPVLMIYSDGRRDHYLTYHSMQLSLMLVFVNLDLDMLIAARTAPGHSWANLVERLMSLLDLVYHNVVNLSFAVLIQKKSSRTAQEWWIFKYCV